MIEARAILNNSIVVCLHGCNEVNEIAVEMALESENAAWVTMPCCIRKAQYLRNVNFDDDNKRYHVLCGAFAAANNAELVSTIDSRITNKNIIIAGSSVNISTSDVDINLRFARHVTLSSKNNISSARRFRLRQPLYDFNILT